MTLFPKPKTWQERETIGQYPLWVLMQKPSTKYEETEFNNTLKGLYAMTEWDLYPQCKDGSKYEI